jgi:hypothetical protein
MNAVHLYRRKREAESITRRKKIRIREKGWAMNPALRVFAPKAVTLLFI